MITLFINPITLNKMKFNPKPVEDGLFTADELIQDGGWGGSRNFVWDHEKYWKPFLPDVRSVEVKAKQMARWRTGARVGCDECTQYSALAPLVPSPRRRLTLRTMSARMKPI